jgi:hypothetical protein
MTTALEGGEGSASRPGRSLPPGKTRYPLYRRLGGPQGRSGQVRIISPPPGFDPRTVQPVASRYTDYATRPTDRKGSNPNANQSIIFADGHESCSPTSCTYCLDTACLVGHRILLSFFNSRSSVSVVTRPWTGQPMNRSSIPDRD